MKTSAHSLFVNASIQTNLRRLLVVALLVLSNTTTADTDTKAWRVNGFLSQSAFYTSDNNFAGDSDDGVSTDFNEAGLNASLNLPANLRLSGQVLARNAGHYDNGELRTDYFNLDWQYWSSADARAGMRIGRVRNAYGLYNETRDVAHTRPGITLPGVIYLEQSRDLNISRDGVGFYSDIFSSYGTLALEAGTGRARVSDRLVKEALMSPADGIEPDDARITMLAINWEDADGHWRFAFSQYRITSDVSADLGIFFPGLNQVLDGDFELDTSLLSVQYSTEQWQLTAEWLRFDYDLDFEFVSRRYPGEGAYLQYTWIFSPAWQLYGRYENGVMDRHHRNGSTMEQFCGDPFLNAYCSPRSAGFRRDSSIGVRWDINSQWMIITEAHYIEGTMGLPYSDNPIPADVATYWTLFGIELAFRF
jgi:hypothetical protein